MGVMILDHSHFVLPTTCKSFPGWMDGWMTCDFKSFSTVFQSYQDDGKMIMKGCVQWNPVYGRKDFRLEQGSRPDH